VVVIWDQRERFVMTEDDMPTTDEKSEEDHARVVSQSALILAATRLRVRALIAADPRADPNW
jgi:hypothetical protein